MFQLLAHSISSLPSIIASSTYRRIIIHYCTIAITSVSSLLMLHHSSWERLNLTITISPSSHLHLITGLDQHCTIHHQSILTWPSQYRHHHTCTSSPGLISIAPSSPSLVELLHYQNKIRVIISPTWHPRIKNKYHHSIGDIMQCPNSYKRSTISYKMPNLP